MKRALVLRDSSRAGRPVLIRGSKGAAKSTAVRCARPPLAFDRGLRGRSVSPSPGRTSARLARCLPRRSGPSARLAREFAGGRNRRSSGGEPEHSSARSSPASARSSRAARLGASGHSLYRRSQPAGRHLVDSCLDAAAMGVNHVSARGWPFATPRGSSCRHDESRRGELRPNCSTGSGWSWKCRAMKHPRERAEVVRRRLAFRHRPGTIPCRMGGSDARRATHRRSPAQAAAVTVPSVSWSRSAPVRTRRRRRPAPGGSYHLSCRLALARRGQNECHRGRHRGGPPSWRSHTAVRRLLPLHKGPPPGSNGDRSQHESSSDRPPRES